MGKAKRRKMRGEYPAITAKKRSRPGLSPEEELLASSIRLLACSSEKQINEANRIFFDEKSVASEIHPIVSCTAIADAVVCGRAVIDNEGLHLIRPTKNESIIRRGIANGYTIYRVFKKAEA